MAQSPVQALVTASLLTAWIGLMAGADLVVETVPSCDSPLDVLTGCGSTFSAVLAIVALGAIPGIPPEWVVVDVGMLIVGLGRRAVIVWGLVELFRGI